jgi:hypothetical protein
MVLIERRGEAWYTQGSALFFDTKIYLNDGAILFARQYNEIDNKFWTFKTSIKEFDMIPREEYLARRFHEIYERLAPKFGYETREETREFDPNSKNGKLMVAVCLEIMNEFGID